MRLFGIAHGNVGSLATGLRERYQPSVNAACDNGLGSRGIFATDRKSKISFLVDTGTDICSYPRNKLRGFMNEDTYELFATNWSCIATYGTIPMSPDRRELPQLLWIVARRKE